MKRLSGWAILLLAHMVLLAPSLAHAAAFSDFNNDGRSDIFWRNSATGENYLYPMDGTTILGTEGYARTVADQSWKVAGIGDFDGDGMADILWRNASTGENYLYLMNGSAITGEGYIRTVADQNWKVAGVGDFDGDGKADVLWRNTVTGENYLYPMNGLAIKATEGYLRTVASQDWQVAGVGKFDADANADILWRNSVTGENYLYPMNALAILPSEGYLRTVADLAWKVVGTADFDGDLKSDILWRNSITGENYLYPMDGTTILGTEGFLRTVPDQDWRVQATGDYDGDGHADVLWRHSSTGENYLYLMNGTAIAGEGYLRTVADQNWSIAGAPGIVASLLRCDSPIDGASIDLVPGAGVPITGTALGLSNVRVNGALVAVAADHTFSAMMTGRYGMNFVELTAIDGAGTAHTALCAFLGAERWAAEGARFDDALMFRLEQPGWTKLLTRLPAWFSGPSLPQSLDSSFAASIGHTVIGNCSGLGTCTDIQYLGVTATLRPGGVTTSVTNQTTLNVNVRHDIRLRLRVRGTLSGVPSGAVEGDVIFTNTASSVDVALRIDAATGIPYAMGERINTISIGTVTTQFTGLQPEFLSNAVSVAQDALLASLGVPVLDGAAGLFEGLLAGMDVTLPAAGFPVGRLDGTANVTVALTRWSGIAMRDNGLTLLTGLRVTEPLPPPAATGRIPLPLSGNLEVPTRVWDAWLAVHVGVYNQVLQALWRAGLFDGTVDGAALGTGLPAGTSLSVQLRTMPVVTGFDPSGATGLDVGALDLVVTHPNLPPGLRVTAGARVRAQAALTANDLAFGGIVLDELRFSSGAVTLDAASQAILQDLLDRLVVKLAGVALNDSLPVLPATVFTFPASLGAYGMPAGGSLVGATSLLIEANRVTQEGNLGFVP